MDSMPCPVGWEANMGEFSSAVWRAGSLMLDSKRFKEAKRQREEDKISDEESAKAAAKQQQFTNDLAIRKENRADTTEARQSGQDVWGNTEKIFKTTGDPDQALGYLNKEMGTDFEYGGSEGDWIHVKSKEYGEYAWNWRTDENKTLRPPKKQPPKMQTYNKGGQEITEWTDEEGKVQRSASAPRWKPGADAAPQAQMEKKIGTLVKAYNANLKGVAQEVTMYLQPEDQAALAGMSEEDPAWMNMLMTSVDKASIPTPIKQQLIQKVQLINQKFLPMINEVVGIEGKGMLGGQQQGPQQGQPGGQGMLGTPEEQAQLQSVLQQMMPGQQQGSQGGPSAPRRQPAPPPPGMNPGAFPGAPQQQQMPPQGQAPPPQQQGKQLDAETAQRYVAAANGDLNAARQAAAADGYIF